MSKSGPEVSRQDPGDQAFRIDGRTHPLREVKERLRIVPGTRAAARWGRRVALETSAIRVLARDRFLPAILRGGTHADLAGQAQVISVSLASLMAGVTAEGTDRHAVGSLTWVEPLRTQQLLSNVFPLRDDTAMLVGSANGCDPARSAAGLLYLEGIATRPFDWFLTDQMVWLIEDCSMMPASPAEIARIQAMIARLAAAGEVTCAPDWDAGELFRTRARGALGVYCGYDRVTVADRTATVRRILDDRTRVDLHYGNEVAVRGGRYPYQTIPGIGAHGRRETSRRWELISSMLTAADESLTGRVVLDIGCNAGMMLAAALSQGALWALGWDRPVVARHARELLFALGYTRFDVLGEDLHWKSSLVQGIPQALRSALDGCVVLYLAIRHHLGFMDDLGRLPWKLMIYEGGESERTATLDRSLEDLRRLCAFDVVDATDFRDGETGTRPVALLARRD